jgi:tetratricopeptide (TPR) repeat protein
MSYRPRRGGTIDAPSMARAAYVSLVIATTALIASAAPAPALAQPSEEARTRALDLFDQAETAYLEGRIDDAIALLDEARTLQPDEPVLLYNLARAYEAAGRDVDALGAYEGYLAAEPGTPDRGAIARRIDALRIAIAERERLAAENEQRRQREIAEARAGRDTPWPWVVLGTGAAGLAAGVVLGSLSLLERQAAIDATSHADATAALGRAETDALAANVLFAAGGAVALAGLIWGIVVMTAPIEDAPVTLTPGGVAWRF